MDRSQRIFDWLKSYCQHNDLMVEAGATCFYLSEETFMMSGGALRQCIALADMIGARYYIGLSPSGRISLVMYIVGTPYIPF